MVDDPSTGTGVGGAAGVAVGLGMGVGAAVGSGVFTGTGLGVGVAVGRGVLVGTAGGAGVDVGSGVGVYGGTVVGVSAGADVVEVGFGTGLADGVGVGAGLSEHPVSTIAKSTAASSANDMNFGKLFPSTRDDRIEISLHPKGAMHRGNRVTDVFGRAKCTHNGRANQPTKYSLMISNASSLVMAPLK